jgi:hypothetical protein
MYMGSDERYRANTAITEVWPWAETFRITLFLLIVTADCWHVPLHAVAYIRNSSNLYTSGKTSVFRILSSRMSRTFHKSETLPV